MEHNIFKSIMYLFICNIIKNILFKKIIINNPYFTSLVLTKFLNLTTKHYITFLVVLIHMF